MHADIGPNPASQFLEPPAGSAATRPEPGGLFENNALELTSLCRVTQEAN